MVAVWMVAYNHEKYVREAVESVMMQKTSFPVRLIIGEDCSTDNTRNICIELANKYKDKITLILQETNTGGIKNARDVYKACFETGADYIALLEGDDYWTDPLKLQKQFDILEKEKDCMAVFHNVAVYNDNGFCRNIYDYEHGRLLDFEDLVVKGHYLKTCALFFRNTGEASLKFLRDDNTLGFYLLSGGKKAYYLHDVMAAYRVHIGGAWSKKDQKTRFLFSEPFERIAYELYIEQYPRLIKNRLFHFYLRSAELLTRSRNYQLALYCCKQLLKNDFGRNFRFLQIVALTKSLGISFLRKTC